MWHACGRGGLQKEFWCGNVKERRHFESTRPRWKNDIKMEKILDGKALMYYFGLG
jgi:hypothetical protein